MGRATHNKHTQCRINKNSILNIKTSNMILNSLQALKDVDLEKMPNNLTIPCQLSDQIPADYRNEVIPHGENDTPIESITEIYSTLSKFSLMAQKIVKWYDNNEVIIKNQDQLASDILHDFELGSPKDLYRAYKFYLKLRQSRQIRRKAKNENKMLYPLYNYIKSNPTMPREMRNICEKCAGIQYDIQNAKYVFRTNGIND